MNSSFEENVTKMQKYQDARVEKENGKKKENGEDREDIEVKEVHYNTRKARRLSKMKFLYNFP